MRDILIILSVLLTIADLYYIFGFVNFLIARHRNRKQAKTLTDKFIKDILRHGYFKSVEEINDTMQQTVEEIEERKEEDAQNETLDK